MIKAEDFLRQTSLLHDMWDNTRGRGKWDTELIAEVLKEYAREAIKADRKNVAKNAKFFLS